MTSDLAAIITAIGGVIGTLGGIYSYWCKYNQDTPGCIENTGQMLIIPKMRIYYFFCFLI